MVRIVVVAHPGDEVVALGARLHHYRDARFVHVTAGVAAAHAGVGRVFADAGVDRERIVGLGCPPGRVADRLRLLEPRLRVLLADADLVLTHPYDGLHPDRDATAMLVHRAARPGATIVEMGRVFPSVEGAGPELILRLGPELRAVKARRMALSGCVPPSDPSTVERFRRAPHYEF